LPWTCCTAHHLALAQQPGHVCVRVVAAGSALHVDPVLLPHALFDARDAAVRHRHLDYQHPRLRPWQGGRGCAFGLPTFTTACMARCCARGCVRTLRPSSVVSRQRFAGCDTDATRLPLDSFVFSHMSQVVDAASCCSVTSLVSLARLRAHAACPTSLFAKCLPVGVLLSLLSMTSDTQHSKCSFCCIPLVRSAAYYSACSAVLYALVIGTCMHASAVCYCARRCGPSWVPATTPSTTPPTSTTMATTLFSSTSCLAPWSPRRNTRRSRQVSRRQQQREVRMLEQARWRRWQPCRQGRTRL
jgi:hypothetical protein